MILILFEFQKFPFPHGYTLLPIHPSIHPKLYHKNTPIKENECPINSVKYAIFELLLSTKHYRILIQSEGTQGKRRYYRIYMFLPLQPGRAELNQTTKSTIKSQCYGQNDDIKILSYIHKSQSILYVRMVILSFITVNWIYRVCWQGSRTKDV